MAGLVCLRARRSAGSSSFLREGDECRVEQYFFAARRSCHAKYNLARAYELAGRYEESALVLRKVLSWHAPSEGSFWSIGRYWLFAGRPDEALAVFEQESDAGLRDMGVIMALHDLGRMDEFEERLLHRVLGWITQLENRLVPGALVGSSLACVAKRIND